MMTIHKKNAEKASDYDSEKAEFSEVCIVCFSERASGVLLFVPVHSTELHVDASSR